MDEYVLAFAPHLIPHILDGTYNRTYRKGEKYSYLKSGDIVGCLDQRTNKQFATIKVLGVQKILFKDLPLTNPGHRDYASKEEQRKVFEVYYAEVKDNDAFLIIEFRKID